MAAAQNELVLSIDVGTRNLGMVMVTRNQCVAERVMLPFQIHYWELLDLHVGGDTALSHAVSVMVQEFERRPVLHTADVVVIEQQMNSFGRMSGMGFAIQSYFLTKRWSSQTKNRPTVMFMNASHKLKAYDRATPAQPPVALPERPAHPGVRAGKTEKDRYQRRLYAFNKKCATVYTWALLRNDPVNTEYMRGFKKKDDLCDPFLQAIAYIERSEEHLQKSEAINRQIEPHAAPPQDEVAWTQSVQDDAHADSFRLRHQVGSKRDPIGTIGEDYRRPDGPGANSASRFISNMESKDPWQRRPQDLPFPPEGSGKSAPGVWPEPTPANKSWADIIKEEDAVGPDAMEGLLHPECPDHEPMSVHRPGGVAPQKI